MPDQNQPQSLIYNSLAAGEVSPGIYARTDLAKFHQGAFTMRNFFVDYKGGARTRPGTQFIGFSNNGGQYVRLYPFKYSASVGQTYILVFSNNLLEFIKNPGGAGYPNSSNSGFIFSGGVHYTVATPYAGGDVPNLKFSQLGNILTITHPSYPRYQLTRVADTNWSLTREMDTIPIAAPTMTSIAISGIPPGSTDPQNTIYIYAVSAVDAQGNESAPSTPLISNQGIDIGATLGSITVEWSVVPGAQYYKVYKGLSSGGGMVPPMSQELGFCGYSYGPQFVDANIVPDFTKTPLRHNDPFSTGQITGYTITNPGSGYANNGTVVIDTVGGGPSIVTLPVIYPIFDNNNNGATASIVGLDIVDPGQGFTTPPTLIATSAGGGGSGFSATVTLNPQSGTYPAVSGLFQQREVYAASNNQPNTIWLSRSGAPNDFRHSNPAADSDSLALTIASPQVNTILWVQSMPGGLVIGTDSGVVQLTGGSAAATNPLAVTPTAAVIVPQTYFGAAPVPPIVINYDILYVQSQGSIVRDLQYNFFVNIYTGTDITTLSSHLFYPHQIVQWAYQDSPNKVIWALRDDESLLSLTYLKEQEIMGWARHDTFGAYESIAVVQEGNLDAVYVSVVRGAGRYIERFVDQVYHTVEDAWCLDAALSSEPFISSSVGLTLSGTTGNITITSSVPTFVPGNVGMVVRAGGGKAVITAYGGPSVVSATVDPNYPFAGLGYPPTTWRIDYLISTVTGLTHLNGYDVMALVDGVPQGPFLVQGSQITLTTPGSQVVVGLPFVAQVQPLYADVGGGDVTLQGRRKKATAATIRFKDTAGAKWGTDFGNLRPFTQGTSGTDPPDAAVPPAGPGLVTGDQRMIINQQFNRVGSVAVQQDQPLPCTVLGVIPEVAQGDTR